jgi:serine/threonine-protein kinase
MVESVASQQFLEAVHSQATPDIPVRSWTGPPSEGEDDLLGTTLCNTYNIVRLIGEGGMGRVYEARHTRIAGKRFAIKTLHPEFVRQREVVTRFQREVEAAAAITSPHVVGVYDVDRAPDGRPFLVAEYLDGEELGQLLERVGKLELGRAVRIVRQVCKALAAAHERNIVHRDVKPENVFLAGDPAEPMVKVLDFGISRIATESGGTALTRAGMVMGTPAYMSPEQARGERVDHRADIYGVGAILYTSLTGSVPFEREDAAATVVAVLTQEPPRPRAIQPSIPEALEFIIQRAMARDPDARYQSMRDLYEALAPFDPKEPHAVSPARLTVTRTMAEEDVRDARALLVTLVIASLLVLVVSLVNATAAVMRLAGVALSRLEISLLLIGGVCGLVTPTVLIIRSLKRHAWNNSLQTVQLVQRLRRPLIAAGCTYGFTALLVHLLENVILRVAPGVAWPVWDVVLFGASMVTGGIAASIEKPRKGRESASSRPLLLAMGLLACVLVAAIVPVALRGGAASNRVEPGPTPSDKPAGSATAGATASAEEPSDRARMGDLARAREQGVDALRALSQRFPKDPVVMKELMLAEAATPDGLPGAVKTAMAMLQLSEDARDDASLHQVLLKAIDAGAQASKLAFEVMASKMGSVGPDLLYQISTTDGMSAHHARANELLADPKVRALATDALIIALDLRAADKCRDKVALLDRAAKKGDDRSIKILRPLTAGTRSGCGFLKLGACPPPCGKDTPAINRTILAIETRDKQSP